MMSKENFLCKRKKLLFIIVGFLTILFVESYVVQAASYSIASEYDSLPADTKANCVSFARYKVPSLPNGLNSLNDKKAIINSHTPMAGVIAITQGDSSYGHIAYVEAVNGNQITTLNGGYTGQGSSLTRIGRITGTEAEQKILGYWYPSNISSNLISLWGIEERKEVTGITKLWAKRFDSDLNHYAIFEMDGTPITGHLSADNDGFFSVEIDTRQYGNGNHTFTIRYANTNAGYSDSKTIVVKNPIDTQPPALSNLKVSDVTADGYTVSCTVTDDVGVARVRFPSWNSDIHQYEDAVWLNGTISGNTASVRVNLADLKSGSIEGNYITDIYVYDFAGNCNSVFTNNHTISLFIDRTPPVVTEISTERVEKSGYWVRCKVTDNLENNIDRVQFPTWTVENGQDDLVEDWRTNSILKGSTSGDDYYTFYVDIKDHNNEMGNYRTHIYAYDKYGNCGKFNYLPDIQFMEENVPPEILNKEVTYSNDDIAHIKITATDNTGLGEMYSTICTATGDFKEKVIPIDGIYEFEYKLDGNKLAICHGTIYDQGGNKKDFKLLLGKPEKELILKIGGASFNIEKTKELYPELSQEALSVCYYESDFLNIEDNEMVPLKTGITKLAFGEEWIKAALNIRIVDNVTIILNKNHLTLTSVGASETLTTEEIPVNVTDNTVIWSSSNPSVASVDQSGKVTALTNGTTVITVMRNEDGQTAKCTVTVNISQTLPTEPSNPTKPTAPGTTTDPTDKTNTTTPGSIVPGSLNTKTITIKAPPVFKVKAGKKKLSLFWKKISDISGYQIQISTKKNFKRARTISVSSSKTKYTKKGLKSKKKYYIRIRAYQYYYANGSKIVAYSQWIKKNKKTK